MPNRPYLLCPKDGQVVDEAFDKLHDQGKMGWVAKGYSLSDFQFFVVWKTPRLGAGFVTLGMELAVSSRT